MRTLIIALILMSFNICCTQNKTDKETVSDIKISDSITKKGDLKTETIKTKLPEGNLRAIVINKWYHDPNAYTQGFLYHNGYLYESTGNYGTSSLRKIELETGKIIKIRQLSNFQFAEGIAIFDNKIYQLTWRNRTCFVYDIASFNLINSFNYDGEGWGLTSNEQHLVMSDGSNKLKFIAPNSFKIVRTISVTDGNKTIDNLNELEFINGEIFANIYMTNYIIRINPHNGEIIGRIDLSPLYKYLPPNSNAEVLNGIAFDNINDRYFVTGKYWEYVFEIKFAKQD